MLIPHSWQWPIRHYNINWNTGRNGSPRTSQSLLYYYTPFSGHFSRTTQVSCYQKGKTNLDFTETRDSEWQWHQLGYILERWWHSLHWVYALLRTHNYASTLPPSFLQAWCPSCRATYSIIALKWTYKVPRHLKKPIKAKHSQSKLNRN